MKTNSLLADTNLLWLTDLHLDRATVNQKTQLLKCLKAEKYEKIVITGDISSSSHLIDDLKRIASACAPKPVYIVLGNHDFYGSSIAKVNAEVEILCRNTTNLVNLDGRNIVRLSKDVGMIGHGGWADARAGYRSKSAIESPDHRMIDDFRRLSRASAYSKMEQLGRGSANVLREILPYALTCYKHLVIATHVPPYPRAVQYNRRMCGPSYLPHFCNVSAGLVISSIARGFPKTKITILAGHTHSQFHGDVTENVQIYVGAKSGLYITQAPFCYR